MTFFTCNKVPGNGAYSSYLPVEIGPMKFMIIDLTKCLAISQPGIQSVTNS